MPFVPLRLPPVVIVKEVRLLVQLIAPKPPVVEAKDTKLTLPPLAAEGWPISEEFNVSVAGLLEPILPPPAEAPVMVIVLPELVKFAPETIVIAPPEVLIILLVAAKSILLELIRATLPPDVVRLPDRVKPLL